MFLIIDQGTTSTKVMLFDLNGKKVDSSQKSFEQVFPNNGWVEHNPEEIIGTVISCCNEIIENNPNLLKINQGHHKEEGYLKSLKNDKISNKRMVDSNE